MTKKLVYSLIIFFAALCFSTQAQNSNLGFELTPPGAYSTGNAVSGWTLSSGTNTYSGVVCSSIAYSAGSPEFSIVATPIMATPYSGGIFSINNVVIPNSPLGGLNVARIQDANPGSLCTKLQTTLAITASSYLLAYAYCGSWENGGHPCCNAPSFRVRFRDCSTNAIIDSCTTSETMVPPGPNCNGMGITTLSLTNGVSWTNWVVHYANLFNYIGSCVVMEIGGNDCISGAHHGSAYFDAAFVTYMVCPGVNPINAPSPVNFCAGSGQAQLVAPPGYLAYQWYAPVAGTPSAIPAQSGGNTPSITISNPVAGSIYTLQVQAINGCTLTILDTLQYTQVSIAGLGATPTCSLGSGGSATVAAGGSGTGYNYLWTGPSGAVGSSSLVSGLSPGIYTVNVNVPGLASCGTTTTTVTVGVVPTTPVYMIKPYCGNQAFLTAPAGSSNIKWYAGTTPIAVPAGTATALTATASIYNGSVYWLSCMSPQGCKDSIAYVLNQMAPGNMAIIFNPLVCPGANGQAVLSMTAAPGLQQPGYSFSVFATGSPGTYSAVSNQTVSTFTVNLNAGASYSVTAFDGACQYTTALNINAMNVSYSISPTTATLCPGDNLSMAAAFNGQPAPGQYTYSWTPATFFLGNINTSQSTLLTPSTVPLGTSNTIVYTLVVTPTVMNCPVTHTAAITFVNLPQPTVSAVPPLCLNATSLAVTGNPPGGVFGNTTQISLGGIITPSVAGVHTFTYSQMPNSCVPFASAGYTVYGPPVLSVAGNSMICSGQTATLTASGASTYSWSSGATTSITTVTPYTSSDYTVTGMAPAPNCASMQTVMVTVNPSPTVSIQGDTVICNGANAVLVASGALSYVWSNTATSPTITISPNNTYTLMVTGNYPQGNCNSTASVTVYVYQCTGISEVSENEPLKIYPNPTSGNLLVECTGQASLAMYDALGKLLFEKQVTKGRHELSLSNYNNGVYLLKWTQGANSRFLKVIKTD